MARALSPSPRQAARSLFALLLSRVVAAHAPTPTALILKTSHSTAAETPTIQAAMAEAFIQFIECGERFGQ